MKISYITQLTIHKHWATINIVFVCPHTYLPPKKPLTRMVFMEFLKKKLKNYVFTEIWIPKTKFGSGFSHSVRISASMSEDKDIKTVIIIQFTIIVYIYVLKIFPTYLPIIRCRELANKQYFYAALFLI